MSSSTRNANLPIFSGVAVGGLATILFFANSGPISDSPYFVYGWLASIVLGGTFTAIFMIMQNAWRHWKTPVAPVRSAVSTDELPLRARAPGSSKASIADVIRHLDGFDRIDACLIDTLTVHVDEGAADENVDAAVSSQRATTLVSLDMRHSCKRLTNGLGGG